MHEDYYDRREEIIKNFRLPLIMITAVMGIFIFVSIRNVTMDAQGPKDLAAMDILESNGAFVKLSFDKMYDYYAEYVVQNEKNEDLFSSSRLYFYPVGDRLLIIEITQSRFREFEQLTRLSQQGENAIETPIESFGRMIPIKSEVKNFTKELMAEEWAMEKIDDALFDEYVWPYMMNTDIPKETGNIGIGSVIGFFGGIYVLFIFIIGIVIFTRLKRLKREYAEDGDYLL